MADSFGIHYIARKSHPLRNERYDIIVFPFLITMVINDALGTR